MSQEELQEENLQEIDKSGDQICDENIKFDALNDESSKLKIELENAKENLLRATAEFENIKKRLEREKISAVCFANEGFAKDLLPVIDALEMARAQDVKGDEVAQNIKQGIDMTIELFLKCFEKHGIVPIATDGNFNPEFHEAMSYLEIEGVESGKIAQVYTKGYLINGRILRPSSVVIAK